MIKDVKKEVMQVLEKYHLNYEYIDYERNEKHQLIIHLYCHELDSENHEHGEFYVIFKKLKRGLGCKKCGLIMQQKKLSKTKEEFIKDVENKYGTDFEVIGDYYNSKTPIKMFCHRKDKNGVEHGVFTAIPNWLLSGHISCEKCKIEAKRKPRKKTKPKKIKIKKENPRKYTIEKVVELLNEANLKYDNSFDWDLTTYKNMNSPMIFICKKCGRNFSRQPTSFVHNEQTCPFCGDKQRNHKYTTEEFIEKSKKIFNKSEWSYEKTEYVNTDTNVIITCHAKDEFGDEHGDFPVTPHAHFGMHSGCPKCSNKYGDGERFIKLAKKIFNNYYNYDKVKYKNALTDVIITCPQHGDFKLSPNRHLCGLGCPKCSSSSLEQQIIGLLDKHNIEYIFRARKRTCKWLGKLELDFYLPKYNIAIECQGLHHFEEIPFYKHELTFYQKHDEMKRKLCEENGIRLLYYSNLGISYPYRVYENLDDLLTEIFK